MPTTESVKAYKCKTCKGTGKMPDNSKCTYCMGSGYIGSDGTYEYILTASENGKFVITDIKLPNTPDYDFDKAKQESDPNSKAPSTNDMRANKEDWDKKMKKFWINLVNVLLIMGLILVAFLYFFVLKEEKALISIGVIILCLLILFNITKSNIFDKLRDIISKNWNEPKDYLYFLKEKRKRESE